jgi:hypothetical protein
MKMKKIAWGKKYVRRGNEWMWNKVNECEIIGNEWMCN